MKALDRAIEIMKTAAMVPVKDIHLLDLSIVNMLESEGVEIEDLVDLSDQLDPSRVGVEKFRYTSPKDGQPVWALVVETYVPPDGSAEDIYYFRHDFSDEEAVEFVRHELEPRRFEEPPAPESVIDQPPEDLPPLDESDEEEVDFFGEPFRKRSPR